MKLFASLLLTSLLLALLPGSHAAEKGDPKAEMSAIVEAINAKLKAGQRTEKELATDIAKFDQLLAKYQDLKTDDMAQILVMKAMLYMQVFQDTDKALPILQQLKTSFPETTQGKDADNVIARVKAQAEAMRVKKNLVVGKVFPDFDEKDLDGKPLSLARLKGKVVLLDFWATWCGPCIRELPHVKATYENYHAKGFEIIGISLDQSESALNGFLKREKMTWPQYFDGEGWGNKLAKKYGVSSIPTTYLIDGEGKIIGSNLRGSALEHEVSRALGK